jgi:multisubunit Na+/H+ antiporter MnhC subunit
MRYIIGLVFFAAGAWLMWSALARRKRAIAAGPEARPEISRSMQIMGDAVPPMVVLALLIIGAKTAIAFAITGATRYLSWLDLAGFLFLLAGYGTSVVLRARYLEPVAKVARRDAEASGAPPRPSDSGVNVTPA